MSANYEPWEFAPPELRWRKVSSDLALAIYEMSEEYQMSINGYKPGDIKAAIARAKAEAQNEMSSAMDQLSAAQEAHAALPAAIRQVAKAIAKEAADGLQELAEFTNGGPVLDDEAPKTPLPPPAGIMQPSTAGYFMTGIGIVTPAPRQIAQDALNVIEAAK